jgi:RNA polymerase sigma-70 factor (ECF subfamily)
MKYPRLGFTWAATQIREEFSDDTWKAFWLTAVEEIEVDAAALALGHTRGSVYALRSRVMKRLKQKVE